MRQLTLSKQIISRAIIEQEVTDRRTFEKDLSKPYWPKYLSGVTILWGYDIGTVSKDKLQTDLKGILPQADIDKLKPCCGVLGTAAKKLLPIDIKMTWEQAEQLFYRTSLPDHARAAAQAYPGLENLHSYEQTVIVGLDLS